MNTLDLNPQFLHAYDLLANGRGHVFITGRAGTGKSTLLQYFREHTTKQVAVLAPTGVAAVNVQGQTIHSFFHFRPDITPDAVAKIRIRRKERELFQALDAIIIDEVSMLRADLLDCVDRFLCLHGRNPRQPFGGIQMIFIGDLFQLPPVVKTEEEEIFREFYESPFFFSAKVMNGLPLSVIDLAKIYRQNSDDFIEILNAIRYDTLTDRQIQKLNERYLPDFEPSPDDFYVYLASTNAIVDRINGRMLRQLSGDICQFDGTVEGEFDQAAFPTQKFLELKVGAQVMLLNNDPEGRWVNGSIGQIRGVSEDLSATAVVRVALEGGMEVEVTPFRWDMYRFSFNEATRQVESRSVGAFIQYPLRLAWAITIHKSQGKTFSHVIVDMGQGAFAHGQTYVALSRCTTWEGLILRRPFSRRDVLVDQRVIAFIHRDVV